MRLVVNNNRTEIHDADKLILDIISKELRYPSTLAKYTPAGTLVLDENGWDGWIRLLNKRKNSPDWFPTGLLALVVKTAQKFNYSVVIEDKRERPEEGFPELVKIPLRDYQLDAVKAAVQAGRGVIDAPPRSGKTRIACELVRQIALPTVWLAPTDRIVQQTKETLDGFFGKNFAIHLVGSAGYKDVLGTPVIVCTAATAVKLPKEFYESQQCIIIDEFHHSGAVTYKKIFDMCGHIYYRYGMTGTFFRSGEDIMAMHALLSYTIYKVSSEELVKRGYLVPTHVAFVPVLAPYLRNMDPMFNKGHGKYGIQEHTGRNQLVCYCTLVLHRAGRRVLILVGTKKQGRLIRDMILNFLPPSPENSEFKPVEFLSTDRHRPVQGRVLESFELGQEVKVLIGTSLLGEGVDMPSTDALVYARGEQAKVSLTQGMYRVATAVPGKSEALVIDFADRHNKKLMQHSMERLKVYYDEQTFSVEVLQNVENLKNWVNSFPKLVT